MPVKPWAWQSLRNAAVFPLLMVEYQAISFRDALLPGGEEKAGPPLSDAADAVKAGQVHQLPVPGLDEVQGGQVTAPLLITNQGIGVLRGKVA